MGNAQWLERSRRAVWHPCTQMKVHETLPLVPIARGEGAWLHDFDGHRYLDAVGSWWVNLFGHCNPRINAARYFAPASDGTAETTFARKRSCVVVASLSNVPTYAPAFHSRSTFARIASAGNAAQTTSWAAFIIRRTN